MAINDLLKGAKDYFGKAVRPLAVIALAYSACGGGDEPRGCQDDLDCREPRVCVEGECIDPNEGEAEAESEGERIPWYEGMCEEYAALRKDKTPLQQQEALEICQYNCERYCSVHCQNQSPSDRVDPWSVCAGIYCQLEEGGYSERESELCHNSIYLNCRVEFGDPKSSFCHESLENK